MNTINLSTLNINEFDIKDTIYIRKKDAFNKPLFLCQFISYNENKREVTGSIIEVENGYSYTAKIGEVIVNKLSQCALYGEAVEKSGHAYYHWFQTDGYALNPMEEYKIVENEMHCNSHPSFGLISFTRQHNSGSKPLFGSSINHSNTISLRICRAEHERGLNNDSFYSKDEIIEVEISQTQFAELITTMNSGNGTPCTIKHINRNQIGEPPYQNKVDIFNQEFSAKMHNIGIDIEKVASVATDMLKNKPNLGKGDRELILKSVESLLQQIKSNIPFVAEQFSEQMDKTITEAKGEIEGFIEHKIRSAGLEAIAAGKDFPTIKELTETISKPKINNV